MNNTVLLLLVRERRRVECREHMSEQVRIIPGKAFSFTINVS